MRRSSPVPGPNWWHRPQRVWLRRAIFQVHLWVGVVLLLYAILIGLSGSALVFREQIERALHPAMFRVEVGAHRLPYAGLIAKVERDRAGWRVSSMEGFAPAEPLTLLLRPAAGRLSANYRAVTVDPYTGEVVADKLRFAGVLGWFANLHYYLLAGSTGLKVSGWMALALVVLCLSGLVVWWPGVSRFASALLFRPHRRWRRCVWDAHAVTGFWFAAPLLVLSVTGCYFAFPGPVTAIMDAAFLSHPVPAQAPAQHEARAGQQRLGVDQAIAQAEHLLPGDAPLGYFALPARAGGAYAATGYVTGAAPYSELVSLQLSGQDGTLLSREDTRTLPLSRRVIQHFFAWHFGSFAGEGAVGMAVRVLWVLIGLAPALLALTAAVLFAHRVSRRVRAARRS